MSLGKSQYSNGGGDRRGSGSGGRQEVLGRTTGTGICKVGHKHLQHVSSCPTEWNLCFCFSFYFCLLDLVGPPPHQLLPATTPRVQSLPQRNQGKGFLAFCPDLNLPTVPSFACIHRCSLTSLKDSENVLHGQF